MDGPVSRRRFFDLLLGAGGVGVAFVTAWPLLNYVNPPTNTSESGEWVDAGLATEITATGFKDLLSSQGEPLIIVAKNDGALVALEKKCPHLGCMVAKQDGELACPCHGAKFTLDGELKSGPAPRGLKRYELETKPDGHVFVGKEVG